VREIIKKDKIIGTFSSQIQYIQAFLRLSDFRNIIITVPKSIYHDFPIIAIKFFMNFGNTNI